MKRTNSRLYSKIEENCILVLVKSIKTYIKINQGFFS